jgi:hypothetical protein
MVAWLRQYAVATAVMEASSGYERGWAEALRQAGIAVRIVAPKTQGLHRVGEAEPSPTRSRVRGRPDCENCSSGTKQPYGSQLFFFRHPRASAAFAGMTR